MEDLNKWVLIVLSACRNNNIDNRPRKNHSYLHGHARNPPRNVVEIQSFTPNLMLPTSCHSTIYLSPRKQDAFDVPAPEPEPNHIFSGYGYEHSCRETCSEPAPKSFSINGKMGTDAKMGSKSCSY